MRSGTRMLPIVLGAASAVIVSAFVFRGMATSWIADIAGMMLTPIAERTGHARGLISVLAGDGDLIKVNADLRAALEQAQAAAAKADEIAAENRFLQSMVGVRSITSQDPIVASVFAYIGDGGVRQAVLNAGSGQGVRVGDIVLSSGGVFGGMIRSVANQHSTVLLIGDPGLEVTGRVTGTDITGLVHVTAANGLILDLVQKEEAVSEGQVIMTSGNDQIPPGIRIGTVRSVDVDSTTLFKTVRLTAQADLAHAGKVFIIHP